MDAMFAIILGVVQGLTEFLPVSSTGHLILIRAIFGAGDAHGLAFDAVLHLATATAVVVYFWKDLWLYLQTFLRMLGRLPVNEREAVYVKALIIGTVPAVALGLLLEDIMETVFRNPLIVAGVLVVGSVLFMFAEYDHRDRPRTDTMTLWKGLQIGFFQSLALIPGMSRSGAAIAGGMLLGLSRSESARFAFLLAVPVMFGAGGKKLLELLGSDGGVNIMPLALGAGVAFFVALAAIHFMLSFVRRHTLWIFIWYRLALALVVVAFVFLT